MEADYAMLHDILGFKGRTTSTYYIGVVIGVSYNDNNQRCLDVRFWMPKAKRLDGRHVQLADLTGVDLIGALPEWVTWDD